MRYYKNIFSLTSDRYSFENSTVNSSVSKFGRDADSEVTVIKVPSPGRVAGGPAAPRRRSGGSGGYDRVTVTLYRYPQAPGPGPAGPGGKFLLPRLLASAPPSHTGRSQLPRALPGWPGWQGPGMYPSARFRSLCEAACYASPRLTASAVPEPVSPALVALAVFMGIFK